MTTETKNKGETHEGNQDKSNQEVRYNQKVKNVTLNERRKSRNNQGHGFNDMDYYVVGKTVRIKLTDGSQITATIKGVGRYWVLITTNKGTQPITLIINKGSIMYYEVM
jgi:small nuclear ribonucleoprotein (snRNP)-like protein